MIFTDLCLLQGWVTYESIPVNEEDFLKKSHTNWEYYYQASIALGLCSGSLLAIASRFSNVLVRPGGLTHEAYIPLYAYGMSVAMIPVFIVTNSKRFNYLNKFGDVEIE